MIRADASTWTRRYEEALEPGVIRARGEFRGKALEGLADMVVEEACARLFDALKDVCLITVQVEWILRTLIERALAHARAVYESPHSAVMAAYEGVECRGGRTPMFLSGLAGVGKSKLELVLRKVLAGGQAVYVDPSHPAVPLVDYLGCTIGSKASTQAVLKTLASPEVASGRAKINQDELSGDCRRWIRLRGACLFGVDEMQFMTQSAEASTLVTRTLLALSELEVPWFVIANYSLGWKLCERPAEARQRLLGDPVIMLPDPPESEDWGSLLKEYQIVFADAVAFKLPDMRAELWNLCAGLKRELVKLLVHSYRLARLSGANAMAWPHVLQAFSSATYSVSREDVNLLIAHAGQGGGLRRDLLCPFEGPEVQRKVDVYSEALRGARAGKVAQATVEGGMNAEERRAVDAIKKAAEPRQPPTEAKVISLDRKRKPRTLDGLLEAGQDFLTSLSPAPGSKP